jgi:hypothetical protein
MEPAWHDRQPRPGAITTQIEVKVIRARIVTGTLVAERRLRLDRNRLPGAA